MKRLLLGAAAALFPALALAQAGPLEACREYAKKEVAREGTTAADVVLERDAALTADEYGRKAGSQQVGLVLSGHGAVVLDSAPSIELSFVCLLADPKRPVFFSWLPHPSPSPLLQCTRSKAMRADLRACLDLLLRTAEMSLTELYAQRFQEANARDEAALAAYRQANEEWRGYREAECARRAALAPKGVSAEDFKLACTVELTRRRALDMR